MSDLPSHLRDRAETKAARDAERKLNAQEARADAEAELRARDEKTERLKAFRLTQEAKG